MRSPSPGGRHRCLHRYEVLEDRLALSAAPAVAAVSFAGSDWSTAFTDHLLASGDGLNHELVDGYEVLSAGYVMPTGSSAQEDTLPWDGVDQLRITFTEDVNVDKSHLAVSSTGVASVAFADFKYYPEVQTAVWTLAAPLTADRYWIDLDADGIGPVTDLASNLLDGEWTNSISTGNSGNGVAGGDFEFAFNVLPGDILAFDTLEWNGYYEIYYRDGLDTTSPYYLARADVDADGVIEPSDYDTVYDNLYQSLPAGTPIGASDDAPSTVGFAPTSIDSAAGDVAFALFDAFEDIETSDALLSFAIESVGDPSLFDMVTIDQPTGQLTVNAGTLVGRSEIVVSATDASGQKTSAVLQVDTNRQNVAPSLTVTVTDGGSGLWLIEGWVTDADPGADLGSMWVDLTGYLSQRVSVSEDGYFFYSVLLDPNVYGSMWAEVSDSIDVSNSVYFEIG